ncbi:MAG: 16S rRNA (uracil(1498)-N(3))-methyltransferase [Rhodospirillales bacterium]|jgi:16S rRNA (uracil1498-N3)-methyltransferase|nr:16S rRNA (uracil(1498)-N(3))-methyltransferase [Rhodospirillales bacterium]HJO97430.1 16S rRNA (uracil(1498)-N(3))-methyltransferase [Rhodospirillales bacterium]
MASPKAQARLFVEADLRPVATVPLSAKQAHYLGTVLRLRAGATIAAFNGRDGEWLARIEALGKADATLSALERRHPQAPEPDLWLAFAPIKRAPIDFLAQKATELGASRLWPVFTRNTQVKRVNLARLRSNAIEAAEQCGRLGVPEVVEPVSLENLIATWPRGRRLLVPDETGGGRPLAEVLAAAGSASAAEPFAILTGPEGGFARSELDVLCKLAFVTLVGLGPRILRADTAALAALACWQALLGDWRRGPAFEAHQEERS